METDPGVFRFVQPARADGDGDPPGLKEKERIQYSVFELSGASAVVVGQDLGK
jgi:hypothetical protein